MQKISEVSGDDRAMRLAVLARRIDQGHSEQSLLATLRHELALERQEALAEVAPLLAVANAQIAELARQLQGLRDEIEQLRFSLTCAERRNQ